MSLKLGLRSTEYKFCDQQDNSKFSFRDVDIGFKEEFLLLLFSDLRSTFAISLPDCNKMIFFILVRKKTCFIMY